jgi:hypothetical protein
MAPYYAKRRGIATAFRTVGIYVLTGALQEKPFDIT